MAHVLSVQRTPATAEANAWSLLIISLAGQNPTPRMRLWRALKAIGAATLRDGVYLLPNGLEQRFVEQYQAVTELGGTAYILNVPKQSQVCEAQFRDLFSRNENYHEFLAELSKFETDLSGRAESDARRAMRQLRRELDAIKAIDFFPGALKERAEKTLHRAETRLNRVFSPGEPSPAHAPIERRNEKDYRGRTWATRRRLWVDRVASAWLIRRFIDAEAKFIWLEHARDCPHGAVGFDFDDAEFTQIGNRVTFEVLLASFGLQSDRGLMRIGDMVHYLDVGGASVSEAAGFETLLAGAREQCRDDDALLVEISRTLDLLYAGYRGAREQGE